MAYADQTMELLLKQYHTVSDERIIAEIEKVVKSRTLNFEDLADINNAFYYYKDRPRRDVLRRYALSILVEEAIVTPTDKLIGLYGMVGKKGLLAFYIEEHLNERIVTCEAWAQLIEDFECIDCGLALNGVKFIVQKSNDPSLLADIHRYTRSNTKARSLLTQKIMGLEQKLSYNDWEEIAMRCAYPSALYLRADSKLDEYYYADEGDFSADTDDP